MNKILFAGLCMAALATSCSNDNDLSNGGKHTVELSATVTAEQTRAAFAKDGSFYWQTGDQIGVTTTNSDNSNTALTFSPLKLTGEAGSSSATFSGEIVGNIGAYAVYPYYSGDDAANVNGNTLTYVFPDEYNYDTVEQSFFGSKTGKSFNPAMFAKISGNSVVFKHLGGVFCIKIEKMPCASGVMVFTTDQQIAGSFTTDISGDTPQLTSTENSTSNNSVKIGFSNATEGQPAVFYVPAPTGSYTNAVIAIKQDKASTENIKTISAGSYTISRCDLRALVVKTVAIDATVAESTSDAESKLASSNTVAITEQASTNTSITIPEASTTTTDAKTVIFQKVSEDASITVSDKNSSTSEASKSVKELTVSVPNVESSDKAPSVTVNMPNTTVTLAGNAGEATFKKVTATTAENTLVVSSGVTIETLEIAQGNVRINSGATVKNITLADGNTKSIVYYENGATLPTTLPTGVTAKGIIETAAQLSAARYKAGNYILMNDLTATTQVGAYGVNVSIDLNGKTLSVSQLMYSTNGGVLTLKNGKVEQSGADNKFAVFSNSTLNLEGVTYTGKTQNSYNCIFVAQNQENVTINVKNSTINGGYYAISTNASTNPVATCTLTLENSTFAAEETGALLNIPGTYTITDCKFSGNHHGALLRGGTYTIAGCEFTLNATIDPSKTTENKWLDTWADGNKCAFAALTIGNYKNTSYQYPTTITFNKGTNDKQNTATVTSTDAYASSYPAMHVCANDDADNGVTITGLDNITLTQSKPNTTGPEYGTTNITVDGKTVDANISKTSKSSAPRRNF